MDKRITTMLLTEYNELPTGLQSGLLLSQGVPLLRRSLLGKKQALLYSLNNFYVEVSWDPDYGLRHLYAFRDLDSLTPYLATIDWHEFV